MPERHNHGKNIIGTIRIQFCAKSFILRMYDVLARHNITWSRHCGLVEAIRSAAPRGDLLESPSAQANSTLPLRSPPGISPPLHTSSDPSASPRTGTSKSIALLPSPTPRRPQFRCTSISASASRPAAECLPPARPTPAEFQIRASFRLPNRTSRHRFPPPPATPPWSRKSPAIAYTLSTLPANVTILRPWSSRSSPVGWDPLPQSLSARFRLGLLPLPIAPDVPSPAVPCAVAPVPRPPGTLPVAVRTARTRTVAPAPPTQNVSRPPRLPQSAVVAIRPQGKDHSATKAAARWDPHSGNTSRQTRDSPRSPTGQFRYRARLGIFLATTEFSASGTRLDSPHCI